MLYTYVQPDCILLEQRPNLSPQLQLISFSGLGDTQGAVRHASVIDAPNAVSLYRQHNRIFIIFRIFYSIFYSIIYSVLSDTASLSIRSMLWSVDHLTAHGGDGGFLRDNMI